MPKLVVRVEKQIKLIDEMFDDLERSGEFKKMQIKVFKAIYKSRINGLFYLMKKRIGRYIDREGNDFFVAIEKGDDEYVRAEKKRFERFMFGDEKTLNKEKEYQKFNNERTIIRVMGYFKKGINPIKKALGEGQVLDFFNRCGISVVWKIDI